MKEPWIQDELVQTGKSPPGVEERCCRLLISREGNRVLRQESEDRPQEGQYASWRDLPRFSQRKTGAPEQGTFVTDALLALRLMGFELGDEVDAGPQLAIAVKAMIPRHPHLKEQLQDVALLAQPFLREEGRKTLEITAANDTHENGGVSSYRMPMEHNPAFAALALRSAQLAKTIGKPHAAPELLSERLADAGQILTRAYGQGADRGAGQ